MFYHKSSKCNIKIIHHPTRAAWNHGLIMFHLCIKSSNQHKSQEGKKSLTKKLRNQLKLTLLLLLLKTLVVASKIHPTQPKFPLLQEIKIWFLLGKNLQELSIRIRDHKTSKWGKIDEDTWGEHNLFLLFHWWPNLGDFGMGLAWVFKLEMKKRMMEISFKKMGIEKESKEVDI